MVDEDAVSAVGDVEGHAFVSLFTGRASILVPYADGLAYDSPSRCNPFERTPEHTILDKCAELLSKTVNELSWGEIQFGMRVPDKVRLGLVRRVRVGAEVCF